MGSMHDYIYEGYDDKREGCLPGVVGSTAAILIIYAEIMLMIKSGIMASGYGALLLPIAIIIGIVMALGIKEILVKIKGKIPKEVTKDVNIIVFRYHALESMAGYRSGKIFHVLFIDWNYTLYNHG